MRIELSVAGISKKANGNVTGDVGNFIGGEGGQPSRVKIGIDWTGRRVKHPTCS